MGDGYLHPAQLRHPDWTSLVDADPAETIRSRKRLLDLAVERGLSTIAFHVGGRGRVLAEGDAYGLGPQG